MGASKRVARLGSLPVSFVGRTATGWVKRLVGADRTELAAELASRNADQLFAVLGELKGGAMKLGQALSVYEALIPNELAEPYHEALIRLQAQAPAMSPHEVYRVLAGQLGRAWPQRFAEFDAECAHAASIGQVHRARWHDGRAVAVKVQYPGAEQALVSDLRTLGRFAGLLQRIVPGADVRALLQELTDRMGEELDYRGEAEHQRAFAAALAGDPRVRVPRVLASAPGVLVSEWLEGTPLSAFARRPAEDETEQRLRDQIGETMVEFGFSSPARVGLLHSDPHHGNFRLLPDGRIGVLDYGAVTQVPGGIPPALGRILRLAADGRSEELWTMLVSAGFVGRAEQVTADDVVAFLGAFTDPLRQERFHYHRAFLQTEGSRLTEVHGDFQTAQSLNLPPQYLMFLRVVLGWMSILSQIDCTVATRRIVEDWVPGFTDDR